MFAPNRHDRLIEKQKKKKPRYTRILFKEYKISKFHRIVLYFPSFFLNYQKMHLLLCTIKEHLGLLSEYSQNDLQCKKSFIGSRLHSKFLQSPSQDSILFYYIVAVWFCAPVCDLGTWVSCKIFFSYWVATKCIINDQKCGEIVDDFFYIPKTFCSMKDDFWAMRAYFMPLVQNFRIWAEMKSNGHHITRNWFNVPIKPW